MIDAPPEVVWRVLIDVERWPEWTPTTDRIERLDEGEFRLGSRARMKLKRRPRQRLARHRLSARARVHVGD